MVFRAEKCSNPDTSNGSLRGLLFVKVGLAQAPDYLPGFSDNQRIIAVSP